MPARIAGLGALVALVAACGPAQETPEPAAAPAPPAAEAPEAAAAPAEPDALPGGLVLALAQFVEADGGKPVPGPARLDFVYRQGGAWKSTHWEDSDGDSIVFHKAMVYPGPQGPRLLSLAGSKPGGTAAIDLLRRDGATLVPEPVWRENFGGKFSRMRDAEIADLYGDGAASLAVVTHDQGVVATLHPEGAGFAVKRLDEQADTFVHEVEVGDLDGDGVLEVYATPSEPNRLDGRPQSGAVVRYVPKTGEGRTVVADLGHRHAKEILVEDVDGDGRDELYVSVEGHVEGDRLVDPVQIRRYDAGTAPDAGSVIATIDDRLSRFLTAGDVDGDGRKELVAATFRRGVWLLRPGADPRAAWTAELIDADSGGFEHAALLTDLDGDGVDELYVASDDHKEVRRYRWGKSGAVRDVIYRRPDDRPIFTWNLMPVPLELIPGS